MEKLTKCSLQMTKEVSQNETFKLKLREYIQRTRWIGTTSITVA